MLSSVWEETLSEFVEAVGSAKPTPGGGAVAALSACFAASLLNMVLEIAAKRGLDIADRLAVVEAQLKQLQRCVDHDIKAFDSFLAARKLPKITELEKLEREKLLNEALGQCVEVPLTASQVALQLVSIAKGLVELAPEKVMSDLGVALAQLDSGLLGLFFNVNINLQGTALDPAFATLRAERDCLATEIASARQELGTAIDQVARKIARS
jgi:formiminotetrahydrofolate cyclodeaminase